MKPAVGVQGLKVQNYTAEVHMGLTVDAVFVREILQVKAYFAFLLIVDDL